MSLAANALVLITYIGPLMRLVRAANLLEIKSTPLGINKGLVTLSQIIRLRFIEGVVSIFESMFCSAVFHPKKLSL